jgi:hypothetical protein
VGGSAAVKGRVINGDIWADIGPISIRKTGLAVFDDHVEAG